VPYAGRFDGFRVAMMSLPIPAGSNSHCCA
jgi:hypothetical protein